MKSKKQRIKTIIIAIISFTILSFILASLFSFFSGGVQPKGNTALIPIRGAVTIDGVDSFGEFKTSSTDTIKQIKKAQSNPSIKAILLDINSPGGSPVASREIATAIKTTNKTTVALIREVGASGAYWISSSADHIIADEMSITGSIGVYSSYLEFAGFLDRYNLTYRRIVSGKYKDTGSPLKKLTPDEKDLLQEKIDIIHDIFVESIAENRDLPLQKIKQLSNGEFYLGIEALELGLIDQTGNKQSAKEWIKQELNITQVEFTEYKKKKSIIDLLTGLISPQSYMVGKGIGSELKNTQSKINILT